MRVDHRLLPLLALVAAAPAAIAQAPASVRPPAAAPYLRAVAAGYKAAILCSTIFEAGRTEAQAEADELRGIYPEYAPLLPELKATVDRRTAAVSVPFAPGLPPRRAIWSPGRGCTNYPVGWEPPMPLPAYSRIPRPAGADPRPWPMGDAGVAPRPAPALAAAVARAFDRHSYGRGETVGVVVLRDGAVVAERYRDGFGPFVANRTWSVAKSIAGTVTGMALAQARLSPRAGLAVWDEAGDPRRRLTYDHVLRMGSGLHGDTAGNRTDAVYFGGADAGEQLRALSLEAAPATRFRYANNDILLAMLSLRRVLGPRYDGYPAAALFGPLGMRHTVAERDWRGNYVLSSQVWTTARDLARLGQFWLGDGVWAGRRLLPAGWMRYMTTPSGPQPASGPGYGATMWLFGPAQGLPAGSYAAQGNRGQYVMVVPSHRLVVVRRGEDGGDTRFDPARFTADVIAAIR